MCWQIHVTEVPGKDVDVCHWVGKQRYVIVKFLRRKHCQQVLSVKQDIHKITATDSDLPNNTLKLYWNKSYCPYYRILWSKSKALFTMGNIHTISFQMNQLKYVYKNSDLQFQLHIQLILKSIFLVQTWVLQGRLGLHFHSFFMVVFLMVCLCKSYFYSSSPEYKLWLSAILISHIHHTSLLTFQHKMSQPHCLLQKPLAIYNVVSDIFHYSQSIFNCSMSLDQHRTLNVLYSALVMFLCWLGTGRFERFVCLKYFSIIIQLLK